jgi:membrane protein
MRSLLLLIQAIKKFLLKDIWTISHIELSPIRSFVFKQIKIFLITFRGFMENKVVLRASALTYYTLLSVVPFVAMVFGVAKGFGLDKKLYVILANKLSGQKQVFDWIYALANSMLRRTKGEVIAGIGLIVLMWSVMRVLNNIEISFNEIWQIKKGRSFFRKFSDYFAIMFIAPIFVILSSTVTVYITTQIASIVQHIQLLGYFAPLIRIFINLIPYCLIWILFSFIYIVIPNTVVKFWPAVISGIITGTIFQITQWIYVKFQISVSSYNAIYGSFAALPLFMLWVQVAWLIVLFGAEMSYASQNYEKYEFENEVDQISIGYRRALSILVTCFVIKKFANSENAPGLDEMSIKLQMPSRIVREITNELVDAGILSQVARFDSRDVLYQPAIDINMLTIKSVIDKLENTGITSLDIANVPELNKITIKLDGLRHVLNSSEYNILIKDL